MKKYFPFFLFSLVAFLLIGCEKEEALRISGNRNGNVDKAISGQIRYSSDMSIRLANVAGRLEIPALRGGNDNLFVVHTTEGKINYALEYDLRKRASRWTAYCTYEGFSSQDTPKWNRNNWVGTYWNGKKWYADPFQKDPLLPSDACTTLEDYRGSKHDRGHMLASADRLNSMEANGQTFYLSNMHPQLAGFNQRGIWYNLEAQLRDVYDRRDFRDTLYIVKGGTIDHSTHIIKGSSGRDLLTPDYFFMAILCKNSDPTQDGYKAIGFWMKHEANTRRDFRSFAVSIDELEQKTGLDLFCNLPDGIEDIVERNLVLSAWKI